MKFKTILINCIKILLIVSLTIFLNRLFMPKYITENKDGRVTEEYYNEKTDLDVICFGSSTVYNAISPDYLWDEYGFTSYTRANASQTLWQSYYLMEDALKSQKPDVILLDMSFMKYGEEFVEEPSNRKTIDGMRLSKSKLDCIMASMWEGEEPITYLLPIFRYHSRWKELTKDDLIYAFHNTEVTYDGFIMEFGLPDQDPVVYDMEEKDSYDFPPKAYQYLDKIVALCKEKEIPLLLMKTPTYTNNWYPEYDDNLRKYADANGVVYTNFDDYKKEMGIDLFLHYNDGASHLNVTGAEVFSAFLGQYLKSNYSIENHKGQETYENIWDKKLERYERDKEAGLPIYQKKLEERGLL